MAHELRFFGWLTIIAILAFVVGLVTVKGDDYSRAKAAFAFANATKPPAPVEPVRTMLPYSEALEVARKTGKPLIVWGGDAFCPMCVVETKDEFVHSSVNREDPRFWVKENGKVVKDTLMLAIRDGAEMKMVAHLGEWRGNHLPTLRKALRLWDQRQTQGLPEKTIRDADLWQKDTYQPLLPPITYQMQMQAYQPAMQYSQPMRAPVRFMRGGASCST